MILDWLLAFGLLLSTATQLRFGDTPFGPGELCLAVWLGLFLCRQGWAAGAGIECSARPSWSLSG